MRRPLSWQALAALGPLAGLCLASACRRAAAPAELQSQARMLSFDTDIPGTPARGFSALSGRWRVVRDATAPSAPNVYAQAEGRGRWQVTVLDGAPPADASVSVRFKAVAGLEDRAAGIIFRVQDPEHYYILRANEVENNLLLFRYADGLRQELAGTNINLADQDWHSLKVTFAGDRILGYFDGDLQLDVRDGRFQGGKVGLWTKADSLTYFDDFRVVPVERR